MGGVRNTKLRKRLIVARDIAILASIIFCGISVALFLKYQGF